MTKASQTVPCTDVPAVCDISSGNLLGKVPGKKGRWSNTLNTSPKHFSPNFCNAREKNDREIDCSRIFGGRPEVFLMIFVFIFKSERTRESSRRGKIGKLIWGCCTESAKRD